MGGTILNVLTVALGSLLGLLIGNRLPERIQQSVVTGLGLVTLVVGIQNAGRSGNILADGRVDVITSVSGDLTVQGDTDRLKQVLLNLVDNAIKHTPEGGTVNIRADNPDGVAVHVSVADTGIGIPPEDLPHVFERFYRVDKSRSRAQGGAGLGLAIAKSIVEAHSGRIGVQSTVGVGG